MNNAIIFSGTGGQGVMSMGIMLAQAAIEAGKHAVYMPSYGPEQRGGSAKCIVMIDKNEIVSPLAGKCSVLVAMSRLGYNKFIDSLLPGGILIYDSNSITDPIARTDIKAVPVPASDLALQVGSPKVANVIVDGILIGLYDTVTPEELQNSLDTKFAKKSQAVRDMNRKALQCGLDYAKSVKL